VEVEGMTARIASVFAGVLGGLLSFAIAGDQGMICFFIGMGVVVIIVIVTLESRLR
jgi:hypothetical protein